MLSAASVASRCVLAASACFQVQMHLYAALRAHYRVRCAASLLEGRCFTRFRP